jgi:hypothetical protein
LCFGNGKQVLDGFTDADMAGDVDSRKSTSGYLITYSGGAVSWQSRLQKCVALSTKEAKYIAITEAAKMDEKVLTRTWSTAREVFALL